MSAAVLSAIIPGIGPVMAGGLGALSLVGAVGGGLAGPQAGGALEHAMADGVPKDELFLYEDALRQGRTVLIVLTEEVAQAEAARTTCAQAGAESLDAARDTWWVGSSVMRKPKSIRRMARILRRMRRCIAVVLRPRSGLP